MLTVGELRQTLKSLPDGCHVEVSIGKQGYGDGISCEVNSDGDAGWGTIIVEDIDIDRAARISKLAKFMALAQLSSGNDYSKRPDLDKILQDMGSKDEEFVAFIAGQVYGFLEREGWVQNETTT